MSNKIIAAIATVLWLSVTTSVAHAEEQQPTSFMEQMNDMLASLHGFIEYGHGFRTQSDDRQHHTTILHETRLQLEMLKRFDQFDLQLRNDIVYDAWSGDIDNELREASVYLFPFDWLDVKAGRQVLTWGTGDYLFLNDLFPKNWQSFFIGRDDEYLKEPSDAIKFSMFPEIMSQRFTIDLVWIPFFRPDQVVTGERISYFNTMANDKAGRNRQVHWDKPDRTFENSVFALRISKNFSGTETAFYFHKGFYTQPGSFDFDAWRSTFVEMHAYGASVRRAIFGGIGNMECALYEMIDDKSGDNPFVDNSSFRTLVGYSRELAQDFNIGLQYYVEYMLDYDEYRQTYPVHEIMKDRDRHLLTVRLTKLMLMQTLEMSLFTFYSPTDEDAYLRPKIQYDWNDHVQLTVGGNIFIGREEHTFFGQLEDNTNLYARIRYSF